jgi:hypothetical protein
MVEINRMHLYEPTQRFHHSEKTLCPPIFQRDTYMNIMLCLIG